jgi:hypothetical protein
MQIHFLEEKLASTKPENSEITIKQNIELKVMNQTLEMELKEMKKANRDLTRANTALQGQKEAENEELYAELETKDREIDELSRRLALENDTSDAPSGLLDENAKLRDSLTLLHGQLQDTNAELEHLRSQLELRSSRASSVAANRVQDLEAQMEQLTAKNSELGREYRSVCEDLNAQADELERERDERTKLALEVERLEWEQQRASHERSESRAEALGEREEREAIEEVRATSFVCVLIEQVV